MIVFIGGLELGIIAGFVIARIFAAGKDDE